MATTFLTLARYAQDELSAEVSLSVPDFEIFGVAAANNLRPGRLAFAKKVDIDLSERVSGLRNVALIIPIEETVLDIPFLKVRNPRFAFAQISEHFFSPKLAPGIHPTAIVDEEAVVDPTVSVGPYCVIGPNCKIAAGTTLLAHVTLTRNVELGKGCVLLSHVVIGDDGFGVERMAGKLQKHLPHFGGVIVGDGVRIGTMSAVASGTIEPTRIGDGTMLDNHVHVGHNVNIGRNCQLTACVELSGSVTVGNNVTLGPNSSVIQKVFIGDNSIVGIGAVVTKSVPNNVVVAGVPAKILRNISQGDEVA